jgi:hypothetical protein
MVLLIVFACQLPNDGHTIVGMADGFWIAVVIVVGVLLYVLGKVVAYARQSEKQWREVDQSKLKTWEDEDDRD